MTICYKELPHYPDEVINNPYVFHTYAYAIENLQCYAPSLHDVTVAVTLNDHSIFNFEEFLKLYSESIHPLFVWSIWHYRQGIHRRFTISDFNRVVEIGNFSLQGATESIQRLRHKVQMRVRQLQKENPNAKDSYLKLKRRTTFFRCYTFNNLLIYTRSSSL